MPLKFDRITLPRFKDGVQPPWPSLREALCTPDPGMWAGVLAHAAAAGVTLSVEGDVVLADKIRGAIADGAAQN